ncbi:MAG: SPOR domain-containing protein [Halofilum sp. (in: g-proteobacteria)]|nr:SPOR domain-containing protein [Halofilum sp. (in: g-proteobacteria)]
MSTETDPGGTYFLQVGSFQKSEQADRMKAKVSLLGLDVDIQSVNVSGERWHRVRIGPYADPAKLGAVQRRLRENDIDYLVLREKSSG